MWFSAQTEDSKVGQAGDAPVVEVGCIQTFSKFLETNIIPMEQVIDMRRHTLRSLREIAFFALGLLSTNDVTPGCDATGSK